MELAIVINIATYIYTHIYHHNHQITLRAQISLTLSYHSSFHTSLPVSLLDYILCPYRDIVCKFLLVGHHWQVHVKGSIGDHLLWVCPYFSSSVLYVLFIIFGWFLEIGGWWLYNSCFMGCCFQDLFNIAFSILVLFPSSIFSTYLVSINVLFPYSKIDTTAA